MRRMTMAALVMTLLLALPGIGLAAAGDLDPTFGDGGSTMPVSDRYPLDLALHEDGKLAALGEEGLARWTADGQLDPSFAGDGTAATQDSWGTGQVAVQSSQGGDHLVVSRFDWESVGHPYDWPNRGSVWLDRYTPSGELHQRFSTTVTFDSELPHPIDLEVQPDGAIVQGVRLRERQLNTCVLWTGCLEDPRGVSQMLIRYDPKGGLDEAFGDGGVLRLERGLGPVDLEVEADGSIVTASLSWPGYAAVSQARQVLVQRFLPDGTRDVDFASGPVLEAEGFQQSPSVALDPDGKIIVAGFVCPSDYVRIDAEGCDTWVRRLLPDGRVDPSFNAPALPGKGLIEVEVSAGGDIFLIHHTGVTQLDSAGQVVLTFGIDGFVAVADVRAGELQPDGKIVVLHRAEPVPYQPAMVLSRYLVTDAEVEPPPPPTVGAIAGVVTSSGTPISGAVVDCGTEGKATSSSSGEYRIDDVAEGAYNCTTSASGYRSKKQQVRVVAGETSTANFELQRGRP